MTPVEIETQHVDVNGLRVAYRRAGDGLPLLLLHGAVCDSRVWRTQLETLSDQFTVIAWDAPGCGDSSDPPEMWRMPQFASCLVAFVDAMEIWRPHVLGHSWGTSLALELSRQHPSVPRSLVLAGAYAGWAGSLPGDEVERRLRFALDTAERLPGGFDPTTMPGLFSDAMPPDRARELAAIMSEIRPLGTQVMARALAEADQRDVLPRIRIPTLLLYGDADERSPLTVANELHDQIDSSTLVVMPGLGHEAFLESAETFDAAVRTFLGQIADQRR
jgi:pimeloyl-ACP methyl ester carboxylesterase